MRKHGFCRPSRDHELAEQTRQTVEATLDLLKQLPVPDTFLGRKTQEPFPKEDKSNP